MDTFTLSVATVPANNSLIVSIDGVMQPTSAYSFPTTTSIKFDDAPPDGSQIRILHMGFQVTVATPADGAITSIKLGGSAVTSTKLASSPTIDANRAVTTDHIKDNAITAAKIATDTITAAEIAAGTITGTQISNASITGLDIQANAIDGSHISIGTDQGDMMYYNGTNWLRLAYGTATHVLTTGGSGANPYWAAGSSGTALPSVGNSGNVLTSDGSNWASQVHAFGGGVVNIDQVRTTTIKSHSGNLIIGSAFTSSIGDPACVLSYQAASTSNRLQFIAWATFIGNATGYGGIALFSATTNIGSSHKQNFGAGKGYGPSPIFNNFLATSTSSIDYSLRYAGEGGTVWLNNDPSIHPSTVGSGSANSAGIIIIEYTP